MAAGDTDQDNSDESGKGDIRTRFRGFLPVVVDIETGGVNSATDALLEIAAVLLQLDSEGRLHLARQLHYQVEPFAGANLEPAALEFNGIAPHSPLRGARPEAEVLVELLGEVRAELRATNCTRAVLVGHNAHFDHGFLRAAMTRCNYKHDPFHRFTSFDTASIAGVALGQTVLARACECAGIAFDNSQAHSAPYDTLKTAELFCTIANRWRELGTWTPDTAGDRCHSRESN